MQEDFEEDDYDAYYPPVGKTSEVIDGVKYDVECVNEGGTEIFSVFVGVNEIGERTKEELFAFVLSHGFIRQCDSEPPVCTLTRLTEEEERYELDVVLSDEDYVYAQCIKKLKYE